MPTGTFGEYSEFNYIPYLHIMCGIVIVNDSPLVRNGLELVLLGISKFK